MKEWQKEVKKKLTMSAAINIKSFPVIFKLTFFKTFNIENIKHNAKFIYKSTVL